MRRLPTSWIALGAALLAPAVASGQEQDRSVYPGDRVRVTDERRWTGMVQMVTPDSIRVVADGERTVRPLAFTGIERLEVSLGEKSRAKGFVLGAIAGAVIAGATAAVISASSDCDDVAPNAMGFTPFCERVGPVAVVGSAMFGIAAGGGVGALLGRGERWVIARLPAPE